MRSRYLENAIRYRAGEIAELPVKAGNIHKGLWLEHHMRLPAPIQKSVPEQELR